MVTLRLQVLACLLWAVGLISVQFSYIFNFLKFLSSVSYPLVRLRPGIWSVSRLFTFFFFQLTRNKSIYSQLGGKPRSIWMALQDSFPEFLPHHGLPITLQIPGAPQFGPPASNLGFGCPALLCSLGSVLTSGFKSQEKRGEGGERETFPQSERKSPLL